MAPMGMRKRSRERHRPREGSPRSPCSDDGFPGFKVQHESLSIFFCPFWVSFSVSIIEGIEGCFVSKEADAVAKWHCQAPKVSRSYVGEFWYICYVLCRFAIVDGHGILAKSLSKSRRVKILSDAVIIDPIWTASERGGYRVWFDGRDGISRNGLYVEVIDGTICLVIDGHEWCSRTMSILLPCMRLSDPSSIIDVDPGLVEYRVVTWRSYVIFCCLPMSEADVIHVWFGGYVFLCLRVDGHAERRRSIDFDARLKNKRYWRVTHSKWSISQSPSARSSLQRWQSTPE
ncbi:uncharacterized protein CLUP02_04186 [Colletotrichum lupini]|uniref:Uncharacterized protein n=1 Tax=Colletotrichum lupini TaxID=145971 RepID=A0A9Q8SJW2_9PEZI|nr:uncharacterized protein CLUP02_04186 [Colletotrichum lupini]UQC78709.1 hypothetical protein CLUP02_04186 [Colletotrichum lupini]